jgi:hypothetical protein
VTEHADRFDPRALALDMPLEVTYEAVSETISLPLFKPAGGAS